MNTTTNEDPMGSDYWAEFEGQVKQVEVDRNRRNGMYGGCDPATWGWRRPTLADLQSEREAQRPAR
jgi:hypothetical protein